MARQVINLGSSPNKGDGDPLRLAFTKINENFDEIYSSVENLNNEVQETTVRGDLIGSVFADDSTLLVDGVNGNIPGYFSKDELTGIVSDSTDFADFKIRITGQTPTTNDPDTFTLITGDNNTSTNVFNL